MDQKLVKDLETTVSRLLGAWWQDDRRNWCAYCGIPMRKRHPQGTPLPSTRATRDHVIPRAHKGGLVTIPACRGCNATKGARSLPEFICSEEFESLRKNRHRHQWPVDQLWAVAGLASLRKAAALCARDAVPSKVATSDRIR
ncbi:MAG: HNH endonuclease [Methylibium sp.]